MRRVLASYSPADSWQDSCSRHFTISHSIQMGVRLVQTKLSLLSADSFSKFASVYRELIDDIFNQYRSGTVGAGTTRSRGKLLNVLLLLCAGAASAEAI